MRATISLSEARRIALAAQMSPGTDRPPGKPGPAAIGRVVDRLNLLQIELGQRPDQITLPAGVFAARLL